MIRYPLASNRHHGEDCHEDASDALDALYKFWRWQAALPPWHPAKDIQIKGAQLGKVTWPSGWVEDAYLPVTTEPLQRPLPSIREGVA